MFIQRTIDPTLDARARKPGTLKLRLLRPPVSALFLVLFATAGLAQQTRPSPPELPTEQLPVPQIAPDFRSSQTTLPELGRVGVDLDRQQPLSLREALKMALENNKDIEVGRENVKIAEFDLKTARGVYDPRLTSQSYYERVVTPVSSFLSGGENGAVTQADVTGTLRLDGLSPKGGGNYRVDFSAIRSTTNNRFAALNPQFPTALTVNFVQPLWRGLRIDDNRRQIAIAKKNLSLTDAQFRQRAIETITNVERAYWDLVFSLRNLQIQRDTVRDARVQLEHNRRMVTEGQLAPIDVVSAEAQVTSYEQTLYTALEDVSRSENNLKSLIAQNRESDIWSASLVPSDSVDLTAPAISLADAMKLAMENRPELQQSNLSREINEIDRKYYSDLTKPEVDLTGTYGVVGLAGSINPNAINPFATTNQLLDQVNLLSQLAGLALIPVPRAQTLPQTLLGGYGQSFTDLFLNRFKNVRVGVQISLPLRNRTAEAQLGRSLVERDRIATQRMQLEQTIQVDVRNAMQVVRSTEARLRAAAANRSASEQQYESEKRKLDAGQSTVFLVLQRQTDLTTARGNELRAQTDLNKAMADLQRAIGNALTVNSIVVQTR